MESCRAEAPFESIAESTFAATDFARRETRELCPGTIRVAFVPSELGSEDERGQEASYGI
jgi:hypothetical protein